jgi:hypothetical protein
LRLIKAIVIIGFLSVSGTPADGADKASAPEGTTTYGSLKFDETAFDFGDVYRGTQLSHR